jgi:hypothetical protein
MKTTFCRAMTLLVASLLCQQTASAEALGSGPTPTLRCVISHCDAAEDCRAPFRLGDQSFSVDTGSDFLFQVTGSWQVTPERFKLVDRKYIGDSYLTRTLLNIDIDRNTKALRLELNFAGTGATTHDAVATGSCEAINSLPVTF